MRNVFPKTTGATRKNCLQTTKYSHPRPGALNFEDIYEYAYVNDIPGVHMPAVYAGATEIQAGDARFELRMIPERQRISVLLLLISGLLAGCLTIGFLAYAFVSTRTMPPSSLEDQRSR